MRYRLTLFVLLIAAFLCAAVLVWALMRYQDVVQANREAPDSSLEEIAASGGATSSSLSRADLLQVHFIDVGQGDSIFIQTPDDATALIDGGYDNGQALEYLKNNGVTELDLMIASHPHADHIGGLSQVLLAMPVGEVWTSGATHSTRFFEAFLDAIAQAKVPYREARQGDQIPLGALFLTTLASDLKAPSLNDTSLVLRLEFERVSFLFTLDAEAPTERALLQQVANELSSTVLKVGHHGSGTSSSPDFLRAVSPQIAVYSAGVGNRYGHPHASTIAALQAVGAEIYGTSRHGTVVVMSDGETVDIVTSNDAPPQEGDRQPVPTSERLSPTATPNSPTATPNNPSTSFPFDPHGPDKDCGHFATQAEAQAFFIAAGGPEQDSHRLDRDNDGIACESLPDRPPEPDKDCGHFATQAEAQAFFIAAGGPEQDSHRLDRDNDGIACESLP